MCSSFNAKGIGMKDLWFRILKKAFLARLLCILFRLKKKIMNESFNKIGSLFLLVEYFQNITFLNLLRESRKSMKAIPLKFSEEEFKSLIIKH